MAPIIVLGVPLAYAAGSFIGDAWTGHRSAMPWAGADGRHGWGSYLFLLALSFVAAAGISGFNYARQMLLLTRAEAERAQRIASETQLRLLESQLEPHMLFNTLANLRVLISLDPPRAQQMLDHLIAFLRATLDASRQGGSHSLQAEFRRLDDYLALLAIRMGPRLQVHLDLPTELQQLPVPPLLLQPLVENSIKHGLEPQIDGGRIEIRARTDGERLRLTVQDNGAGLGTATRSDGSDTLGGFGLRQIRERLHSLHGPAARFELQAAPGGGTLACIELPLQPAGPQQTSSTP
jgi:LytS/YehU family sensor histidine kinase